MLAMYIGNVVYLMPKSVDGELAVAVCLREEHRKRARADERAGS
jgi:hypothetical protein